MLLSLGHGQERDAERHGHSPSTRLIVGTARLNSRRDWPEGGVSCLRSRQLAHQPQGTQGVDVLLSYTIQTDLLE